MSRRTLGTNFSYFFFLSLKVIFIFSSLSLSFVPHSLDFLKILSLCLWNVLLLDAVSLPVYHIEGPMKLSSPYCWGSKKSAQVFGSFCRTTVVTGSSCEHKDLRVEHAEHGKEGEADQSPPATGEPH